jgi:hypothetical protein
MVARKARLGGSPAHLQKDPVLVDILGIVVSIHLETRTVFYEKNTLTLENTHYIFKTARWMVDICSEDLDVQMVTTEDIEAFDRDMALIKLALC